MVFFSSEQLQYSPESDSGSSDGVATSTEDHHLDHSHQLAADVPKKRTGRRVFRETRHPVYRGVRSRKGGRWVCELREPNTGTCVWLGTYTNPEMAARAHDVAALAFRGKSACLNFADSAWRLPIPISPDANDVRRAAAEGAEMFRPTTGTDDEEEYSTNAGKIHDDEGELSTSSSHHHNVYGNCYVEEELEVVDLPRLLSEMAEGLLQSPPRSYGAESTGDGWSYVESCSNNGGAEQIDWWLWSH